jgi:putative DNA methylase
MPRGTVGHAFSKQAIPMTWDFPEANPISDFHCAWHETYEWVAKAIEEVPRVGVVALVAQKDATNVKADSGQLVVSTDPPYYDNIGYADLSDFFYVWLRRALGDIYPDLFGTLLVPKSTELVATPYRFNGDRQRAQEFFETGLRTAFGRMRGVAHPSYPLTVYYAFKQTEADDDDEDEEPGSSVAVSTGWETMLEGLIRTGFQITGTWPMRTERSARSIGIGTNALASSVVLVCRPKVEQAPLATRREFLAALKRELPAALKHLQQGNIAPVDLAQASIGPGMAIYSRYGRVLESDGSPMRVRAALALINQALDEYLAEQEGEYDADTRWALAWYEQHTFDEGAYGDAETLSRAKNTSVEGMVQARILHARAGKVRLLRRKEMNPDWDPASDKRVTVWEVAQHLIRTLDTQGEQAAAALLARVGGLGEVARDLAYRLYTLCERKDWASEALPYNSLVVAWPELVRLAQEARRNQPAQSKLGI